MRTFGFDDIMSSTVAFELVAELILIVVLCCCDLGRLSCLIASVSCDHLLSGSSWFIDVAFELMRGLRY
jgi:hypothetical protein